jgi:hypothetical protein
MNKRRIVPAQPGFDLIIPHRTERGFECHPIVAWEILLMGEKTTITIPVTLHGNHHELAAVRYPSGIICVDRVFPKGKEMEALAYVEKRMGNHDRAMAKHEKAGICA